MSSQTTHVERLDPSTRMALAERCVSVTLTDHNEQLANAAVELHLVGNSGSNERWKTDQDYRERAEMGYRTELAVSQYYNLLPTIDYRPPGVGDSGHDYRVEVGGRILTVDVKATRTMPPTLYLTQKRVYSDKYTTPDAYILCSPNLLSENVCHLVGWCSIKDLIMRGEEGVSYGNQVWTLDWLDLDPVPSRESVSALKREKRELWAAADRSKIVASENEIDQCLEILSGYNIV